MRGKYTSKNNFADSDVISPVPTLQRDGFFAGFPTVFCRFLPAISAERQYYAGHAVYAWYT